MQTFWPQKLPRCVKEARWPSYLESNHSDRGAVVFENIRTPWFSWRNRPEEDLESHEVSPMPGSWPPENSTDESSDTQISKTSDTQTAGPSETPLTSLMSQTGSPEDVRGNGPLPGSSKRHLDICGEGRTSDPVEIQIHQHPMENIAAPEAKLEKVKRFLSISQVLRRFNR